MLLWIEGFDAFGTSGAPSPSGVIGRKYPLTVGEIPYSQFLMSPGRYGGYGMRLVYPWNQCYISPGPLTTYDTVVLGCSIYLNAFPDSTFINFYDDSTLGFNLALTSAGNINLYRGGVLLETVVSPISLSAWHYLEIKVKCGTLDGTYELRIDGITVASASGVNTQAGAHTYHTTFRLTGCGVSYSSCPIFDDLYFLDSYGFTNIDFLGQQKVTTLFPNGVGDVSDWTPSAIAAHYTLVDEPVCDDNTTYVESSDSAGKAKELWNYDDLSGGSVGKIAGLQVSTDCRETDVSPFTLTTVAKSATTTEVDWSLAVGTSSYTTKRYLLENDPDSLPWDVSTVNSAQFGIKVG